MSKKSYLSHQIKLISLVTSDLFTDLEYSLYQLIINLMNTILQQKKENSLQDPTILIELSVKKKELQLQLSQLIDSHSGVPRVVRLKNILNIPSLLRNEDNTIKWPEGMTWMTLKPSRKITLFLSALSRALGLDTNQVCLNKIIIKWKSEDILKQIVLDGFYLDILLNNNVIRKFYRFVTSSAGQLRTDKIQCMEVNSWLKIQKMMMCGLTWDSINAKGGINVNKLLAYISLSSGATDEWKLFDIDKSIVIPDFKGSVTGVMKYINPDYSYEIKLHTVVINHVDGSGMMLPCMANINGLHCGNFMIRMPFVS